TSSPSTTTATSSPVPTPRPAAATRAPSSSRPPNRACSRPATCAAGPSSGWRRPWAKGPWPCGWCTSTWPRVERERQRHDRRHERRLRVGLLPSDQHGHELLDAPRPGGGPLGGLHAIEDGVAVGAVEGSERRAGRG